MVASMKKNNMLRPGKRSRAKANAAMLVIISTTIVTDVLTIKLFRNQRGIITSCCSSMCWKLTSVGDDVSRMGGQRVISESVMNASLTMMYSGKTITKPAMTTTPYSRILLRLNTRQDRAGFFMGRAREAMDR